MLELRISWSQGSAVCRLKMPADRAEDPPAISERSSTVTERAPRRALCMAALSPATPPPITTPRGFPATGGPPGGPARLHQGRPQRLGESVDHLLGVLGA